MKKIIIITGAALILILLIKNAKSTPQQQPTEQPPEQRPEEQPPEQPPIQINQGKIINIETNIVGECNTNNSCTINKDLLIYSTFKNIGDLTATNQIGISIDNIIVKTETITLNPNQEYNMIYNTQLDTIKSYNMCGIVIS